MDSAPKLERVTRRTYRLRVRRATEVEPRLALAPPRPVGVLPLSRFATAMQRRSDCP